MWKVLVVNLDTFNTGQLKKNVDQPIQNINGAEAFMDRKPEKQIN